MHVLDDKETKWNLHTGTAATMRWTTPFSPSLTGNFCSEPGDDLLEYITNHPLMRKFRSRVGEPAKLDEHSNMHFLGLDGDLRNTEALDALVEAISERANGHDVIFHSFSLLPGGFGIGQEYLRNDWFSCRILHHLGVQRLDVMITVLED